MDLWSLAKVFGRHWLVLLIALAAASAGVVAVSIKVPTTYASTASVLLLPPRAGGTYTPPVKGAPTTSPKLINPYLSFDSSLFVLVKVISKDASSDQTRAQLRADGADARYTAAPGSDLPTINVVVTDSDKGMIGTTMKAVIAAAVADLARRQKATGVPEDTWVTATSDSSSQITETSDKAKALIVVAALGLAAAISLVFTAESFESRPRPANRDRLGNGQMPTPIKEKAVTWRSS